MKEAELISLAWEMHLQSELLDHPAQQSGPNDLRNFYWNILAHRAAKIQTKLETQQQVIKQREGQVIRVQATVKVQQEVLGQVEGNLG